MKHLLLVLMLTACTPEPVCTDPPDAWELADPKCKDYLAIPGEPCNDGHWLHVRPGGRYSGPSPTVCECQVNPKKGAR